jgi:hypothetical protein
MHWALNGHENGTLCDVTSKVIPVGRVEYSVKGKFRTKIVPSLLQGLIPPSSKCPPEYKDKWVDGEKSTPARIAHRSLWEHLGTGKVPYAQLVHAILDKRYEKVLGKYPKIHPLTESESLNGLEGVRYIDKVKQGTGAGLPCRGPKTERLLAGTPEAQTYTSVGRASVRFIAEMLMVGVNPGIAGDIIFKDEVKNPTKDIRIFACFPGPFNDLMRRISLPVFKYMQENYLLTGMSIGIDCVSQQWGKIYRKHMDFPYHLFWDFKKYDKSHHRNLMLLAAKVFLSIASHVLAVDSFVEGYPALLLLARGLAVVCHPVYNYKDSLFQVEGTLGSGLWLTAQWNTIIQEILLLMAWIEFRGEEEVRRAFEQEGRDTYMEDNARDGLGDDGMQSTIHEAFNLPFISEFLKREIGLTMTSPDKSDELPTSFPVEKWNFLKRGFLEKDGRVYAPIERESILKNVNWQVPTPFVSEEELHFQFVSSALQECAAAGDDRFEGLYNQIVEAYKTVPQLQNSCALFPTYREAVVEAKRRYDRDKDGTSALWSRAGQDANNFYRAFWR